jgi:hypothetical protein
MGQATFPESRGYAGRRSEESRFHNKWPGFPPVREWRRGTGLIERGLLSFNRLRANHRDDEGV